MAPLTAQTASIILLVASAASVNAAVALWGQCGGIGYSGETTCVAGAYCKYSNDWYSQCVPGTATSVPQQPTTNPPPQTTVRTTTSAPQTTQIPTGPARVFTSCTKAKTVALTFDDGPNTYHKEVADILTAAGVKGTFFVNGKLYKCIYENNGAALKYSYDKGHQIASHLWSHPHGPQLSQAQLLDEIVKTDNAIKKITGATPAFIRPPYGEYNDLFRNLAGARGQSLVTWDFDAGDWDSSVTPATTKNRYLQKINANVNNMLTLNHETYDSTVHDVLPYVINLLKSKGYSMVTVAECLGMQPYTSVGSPSTPDSSWVC
ncbi:Carbohydrate esterase 4 protein [Tulasnella sp. 418]|nr:Carbohydrate esterase 4 protein [Tulasnella sp. 418]